MIDPETSPLPSYDRPPVIEVVCGTQYEPLEGFQATAFGLLWQRFREEYPVVEQNPPLAQVIERFGDLTPDEGRVELANIPPLPRLFFVHGTPNWLLQIQSDRFLYNWRRTGESDVYPRFPKVFSRFWSAWGDFLGFCSDEKLGIPKLNQLEVTYINHIVHDEGWCGPSTVGN
ncbi:MAG: TIGR04255 family protein, partial [Phycisphaerales bacterium]